MSNIEMPPALGEIPNTFFGIIPIGGIVHTPLFGHINDPGAFGEYPIGPVREGGVANSPGVAGGVPIGPAKSCGVAEQPTVIGDLEIVPAKSCGDMSIGGALGDISSGGAVGGPEIPPVVSFGVIE